MRYELGEMMEQNITTTSLMLDNMKNKMKENGSIMFLIKQLKYCPSDDEYFSMIAAIIACYNMSIKNQNIC